MTTQTKNKKTQAGLNAKKIRFWIQFHKGGKKHYLNLFVPARVGNDVEDLSSFLTKEQHIFLLQSEIEPQAYGAWDWEILKIEDVDHKFQTTSNFDYEAALSPKEIKQTKAIQKFEQSVEEYSIADSDISFNQKSVQIEITNLPHGTLKLPIDKIYELIEKEINCDVDLVNYKGETILTLRQGSFLNAGLADIKVFKNRKDADEYSLFNHTEKGGIFIRENGILDIGDIQRTKFLSINLANLVKELQHKGLLSGVISGKIDLKEQLKIEPKKD